MTDMLSECMSDLNTKDTQAFIETFCQRCRQIECPRAKWSGDKFSERTSTQVNRLFNPERADPSSSRYDHLVDFKSLVTEAIRLEVSDTRGDWNVPDVPSFFVNGDEKEVETKPTTPLIITQPEGKPAAVVVAPRVGAAQVASGNTPQRPGGILLDGPPVVSKKPDPWSVPIQSGNSVIVKPGATIKMGS